MLNNLFNTQERGTRSTLEHFLSRQAEARAMTRTLTPLLLATVSVVAAVFCTSHLYENAYELYAWIAGVTSLGLATTALIAGVRRLRSSNRASFGAMFAWSAGAALGALVVIFWSFECRVADGWRRLTNCAQLDGFRLAHGRPSSGRTAVIRANGWASWGCWSHYRQLPSPQSPASSGASSVLRRMSADERERHGSVSLSACSAVFPLLSFVLYVWST